MGKKPLQNRRRAVKLLGKQIWSSSQQSGELTTIDSVREHAFFMTKVCPVSSSMKISSSLERAILPWSVAHTVPILKHLRRQIVLFSIAGCQSNSISSLAILYVIFGLFLVCIDARLVLFQQIADSPIAIEAISPGDLPIIPESFVGIPADKSSPITVKQERNHDPVCYPVVGCFDNHPPFDNAASEIPQAPELIDTHFLLFTQEAPTNPEILPYSVDDQVIKESSFNASRWLRIIVHGFINNRDSTWIKPLRDELLKLNNVSERSDDEQIESIAFAVCDRTSFRTYWLSIGEMEPNFLSTPMQLRTPAWSAKNWASSYRNYSNWNRSPMTRCTALVSERWTEERRKNYCISSMQGIVLAHTRVVRLRMLSIIRWLVSPVSIQRDPFSNRKMLLFVLIRVMLDLSMSSTPMQTLPSVWVLDQVNRPDTSISMPTVGNINQAVLQCKIAP